MPFARDVGLIAGVELMQDKSGRTPFPPAQKVGLAVQEGCEGEGLIARAIGDRIAFMPPLIITEAEIAELCDRFRWGLDRAHARLVTATRDADPAGFEHTRVVGPRLGLAHTSVHAPAARQRMHPAASIGMLTTVRER